MAASMAKGEKKIPIDRYVINLTPHAVVIYDLEGKHEIAHMESVAVLNATETFDDTSLSSNVYHIIPTVHKPTYTCDLDACMEIARTHVREETFAVVVSAITAEALLTCHSALSGMEVYVPNTSRTHKFGAVRDEKGAIKGVKGLLFYGVTK